MLQHHHLHHNTPPMWHFTSTPRSCKPLQSWPSLKRDTSVCCWVGSLAFIITSLVTPFKDCLRRRFSNRSICIIGVICCSVSVVTSSLVPQLFYLFFTFGVLYGVGTGLVFKSSLDLLLSRFPSYCGRVSFLILTGSTAGVFAWTPILTALIDLWGWRQTCRISAAVILLVCLPSTLPMGMAPPPPQFDDTKKCPNTKNAHDAEIADGKLKSDRKKARQTRNNKEEIKWAGLKEKRILFMPEAWLFGLANLVSYVSMGFYNVNLVSYATSLGYSSNQGSTLLTIAAASEAGCKLVFAIFVDKLPFRKAHLMAVLSLASTLITLSCAFVPSFSVLCVIGVGMGLLRAAMNALPFPVGMEIFGPRKTSGSNTLILFAGGLGTITSAFAIGGTYDAFNSYDVAIYICTGCLLLTTVLYVLIPLISRLHKVIGLRVRIDEVTGVAEVIPVVEDETVMIEEFVTVL
ncbi:monocarboxylate transporter 7-like isoform X2 [Acanthaster planci]|uniref:Monocarboxylate transporter 7-like isoform X2 n=1 Tax=Acanthaster planci TaxID=133434 RepID=A0A8B7YHM5_ACAPL|nr:monocarboxylate transporter 7-like isoform X2 [Acanthaster planci]